MPSIFNLPLDEIDRTAIRAFLVERNPESVNIEYKRELTDRVHRAVAAMANTYGGLILVGVAERNGLPEAEPVGVPLVDRDRLVSKCFSKIEPPYEPEIAAVLLDDPDRYVLVIRVSEQVDRPLVVDGTVYIRLSGKTEPADRYRMATLFAEQGSGSGFRAPSPALPRGGPYSPLAPNEKALILRTLVRTRVPPGATTTLNSEVRKLLVDGLRASRVERWIADETMVGRRPDSEHLWRRAGFITQSVETVQRPFAAIVGEEAGVAGNAALDLQASRHAGGGVALAVDLIIRHDPPDQATESDAVQQRRAPTYRFGLEQVIELLDVCLGTVLDELAASIFPVITGVTNWPAIATTVALDTGVEPLSRYVAMGRFPRAEGAEDRPGHAFEAPVDVDLRDPAERRKLLLEWIAQMLYTQGYVDFEPHLSQFAQ